MALKLPGRVFLDVHDEVVLVYCGFTEHTYRLVFPFEDKFAPDAPVLLTIVPSGVVENSKVLKPQTEKGLIAFTYPQSISDEFAQLPVEQQPGGNVDGSNVMRENNKNLCDTAFVWRREDRTNALVQTWPTNINDKFRQDFEIFEGVNPDPAKFLPQAASEFQEAMVRLFGRAATSCPIWFCHKKLASTSPAVVGFGKEVLAYLKERPELTRELAIASIDSDGLGFVADGTNGKGEKFEKHFRLTPGERCVVYRKTGWDTMGCIKPLHQFLLDAEFHEHAAATTAEATVCPVLIDPPLSLMEQMQRSGFELVGRDTGDIVVHTPQTDGEGSGSALATFFEHFPQLFQVLDQESIGRFAPFLDEETVSALERRAAEAQADAFRETTIDGVDVPPSSMGSTLDPARLQRRMSASDSLEDSLDAMKQILNNSVMTAEAAIERQQRNYREELHKMQAEQGQLEQERLSLERDREKLVQKEAQLQAELEEVDKLRSQIEMAQTRPKSKFLCC